MPKMDRVNVTITFKNGLVIKYYGVQSCTMGEYFIDVFTPKPDKLTLNVFSYKIEKLSMVEIEQCAKSEVVCDKIKDYVNHVKNTGMGKNKSLEFIEKFIDALKVEREDNDEKQKNL